MDFEAYFPHELVFLVQDFADSEFLLNCICHVVAETPVSLPQSVRAAVTGCHGPGEQHRCTHHSPEGREVQDQGTSRTGAW